MINEVLKGGTSSEIVAICDLNEAISRLKSVTLRNKEDFYPYLPSEVTLETVDPDILHPCALYALTPHLRFQKFLREEFSNSTDSLGRRKNV